MQPLVMRMYLIRDCCMRITASVINISQVRYTESRVLYVNRAIGSEVSILDHPDSC